MMVSMPSVPVRRMISELVNCVSHSGSLAMRSMHLQVEIHVDQAGALALQLVRHAARAEHHDLEILVVGFDRLAQRLAELEAARARSAPDAAPC